MRILWHHTLLVQEPEFDPKQQSFEKGAEMWEKELNGNRYLLL